MIKPHAREVAEYYNKYLLYDRYYRNHYANRPASKPCLDPQADNQCAVRLSCALEGISSGFLDDFDPPDRVHRDRKSCMNLPPHVLGAAELGRYISQQWGTPYTLPKRLDMRTTLNNQPGVIWFEKCYETKNHVRSDHIDFWTGGHYMNEILHESAGGNASVTDDLFMKSKGSVRFFSLVP
jgi:hypothetical protein